MKKRVSLLFIIVAMCIVVTVGGAVTFVNSNSVLKEDKHSQATSEYKDITIYIDLSKNKLSVYDGDNFIKAYNIAAGKYDSPSPAGNWIITEKKIWGKKFGGRWMGLNVPWGRYGIHGTDEPWSIGKDLSHGCIRMRNKDVEELYKMVQYGTPVKIHGGINGPFGDNIRVLKPGNRGSDVLEVQKRLKAAGYYKGNTDGIYGTEMKKAVHSFQKDNKMPISDNIGYYFYSKLGIHLKV